MYQPNNNRGEKNDSTLYFYNLNKKMINFSIKLNSIVYKIYPWNDQYLLFSDKNNKSFGIINIKERKVIQFIKDFTEINHLNA